MNKVKKEIRSHCKDAYDYKAWRNPFHVWFVTLFDKDGNSTYEIQFSDDFPKRDREWMWKLLDGIKERNQNNGKL